MPGRLLPSEKAAPKLQPDLRIIHFNDVYNIQPDTREPAGGIARFQTVMKKYRAKHEGQPPVLTLFSGDALNPSLESIFTKGEAHNNRCYNKADSKQANTWSKH